MRLFTKTKAEVESLTAEGLKNWIEECVTRLGIPIDESNPYDPHAIPSCRYGEVWLGGDHEHTIIAYQPGVYWLNGFNPFEGYDFVIDGTGELEVEIQRCRDESFKF